MDENKISKIVLDVAFKLHSSYGPGLYENVYEQILEYELQKQGLLVERQKPIPLTHEEMHFERAFLADLVINNKVLIEIKSVEALIPVHFKQVITYLKLSQLKLGLLINFNEKLLKNGIRRVVNNL